MPAEMGGAEAFIKTYEETLAMVKEVEQLTINPADYAYEITKRVSVMILWKMIVFTVKTRRFILRRIPSGRWRCECRTSILLLDYAVTLDQVEARIAPDQALFSSILLLMKLVKLWN